MTKDQESNHSLQIWKTFTLLVCVIAEDSRSLASLAIGHSQHRMYREQNVLCICLIRGEQGTDTKSASREEVQQMALVTKSFRLS